MVFFFPNTSPCFNISTSGFIGSDGMCVGAEEVKYGFKITDDTWAIY